MAGEADAILLTVLAFIFPPAAVAFVSGCGVDLCFNILLTLLGYLPGCIHALWIVFKRTEANQRYGYGNWTYKGMGEYVPPDASQQQQPQPGGPTYVQPQGPGTGPPPPPPSGSTSAPAPPSAPAPGQQPYNEKTPAYTQPLPPPAPEEKKYDYQAPPQIAPAGDQKQADQGGAPPPPPPGTGGA